MKKQVLSILLAVYLLLLGGCGSEKQEQTDLTGTMQQSLEAAAQQQSEPTEEVNTTAPHETQEPSAQQETVSVTVSELYSEDGSYTDLWDTDWDYSYRLPYLDAETMGAMAINQLILDTYGIEIEYCMSSIKDKDIVPYLNITYEQYQCGDLLSFVITANSTYDLTEYDTYIYNVETGEEIDQEEEVLAEILGISVEDYHNGIRQAAVEKFDSLFYPYAEDLAADAEILERRSWTIAQRHIQNPSWIEPYFDNEGIYHVAVPVGSLVAADWYYQILTPNFARVEQKDLVTGLGNFVSAQLKDKTLTVRLSQTAAGDSALAVNGIGADCYNTDYEVHGLSADYATLFSGYCGTLSHPYVFLLRQDGRAEYINVMVGIRSGYLCTSGPIVGLENITGMDTGTTQYGGQTMYAYTQSGERIDMEPYINNMENSLSFRYTGDWTVEVTHGLDSGGSYTSNYWLTMPECGDVQYQEVVPDADISSMYYGYLTYLGMNEDGLVYAYYFSDWDHSTQTLCGAYSMWYDERYDGYDDSYGLHAKYLGGVNLFDASEGEVTVLTASYG